MFCADNFHVLISHWLQDARDFNIFLPYSQDYLLKQRHMSEKPAKKPVLLVSNNEAGQRVDNYLFKHRKQLAKTTCYKLMRKGQIRVNGKRVKPMYKLSVGDEVRIPPFVYFVDTPEIKVSTSEQDRLLNTMLFEDNDYLVLNKPAGIAVHKGTGFNVGVIEIVRSVIEYKDVQLAHRLDKDTSGCLLLAKNRQALLRFQAAMKEQAVEKTYTAILSGTLDKEVVVDKALNTSNRINSMRTVVIDPNGQAAKTIFSPIKSNSDITLCQCQIFHGRTHQIRVHAQDLGHPVLGDSIYGQFNEQFDRLLYLHASQLKCSKYLFQAETPSEFGVLFE